MCRYFVCLVEFDEFYFFLLKNAWPVSACVDACI